MTPIEEADDRRIAGWPKVTPTTSTRLARWVEKADALQLQLDDERKRRVRYQDMVYAACNELDRTLGNQPFRGTGVVATKEDIVAAIRRLMPDQSRLMHAQADGAEA